MSSIDNKFILNEILYLTVNLTFIIYSFISISEIGMEDMNVVLFFISNLCFSIENFFYIRLLLTFIYYKNITFINSFERTMFVERLVDYKTKKLFYVIKFIIDVIFSFSYNPFINKIHYPLSIKSPMFLTFIFTFMKSIVGIFLLFLIFYHMYLTRNNNNNLQIELPEIQIDIILPDNNECCICMDKDENKSWVSLTCNHKFHKECIEQWTKTQRTCPICRVQL